MCQCKLGRNHWILCLCFLYVVSQSYLYSTFLIETSSQAAIDISGIHGLGDGETFVLFGDNHDGTDEREGGRPTFFISNKESTRISRNSSKVALYNDIHISSRTRLPRKWKLYTTSDEGIEKEKVDANSCFASQSFIPFKRSVRCLPSLYVIGFEKAGTTILNVWLSHHPNLKTRLLEGRFFDSDPEDTVQKLDSTWHDYLRTLPTMSVDQLGTTWTMEKSPAYAHNPFAPLALSTLVPSARFLLVTRNPTQRAYSMFHMYTNHYPSVTSAILGQPKSYFVKNVITGDVRYIGDNFRDLHPKGKKTNRLPPGNGGAYVPLNISPPSSSINESGSNVQEWIYLSYPPDPIDFDRFITDTLSKFNEKNTNAKNTTTKGSPPRKSKKDTLSGPLASSIPSLREMNGRGMRVLTAGLYGPYIEQWLKYFPPENLIIVPSEDFFSQEEAIRSMNHLQKMLGLPLINYERLLYQDTETGRMEVSGSLGSFFNRKFNSNVGIDTARSMLPETKERLDAFYCDSNRQLKRHIGKTRYNFTKLKDYACFDT